MHNPWVLFGSGGGKVGLGDGWVVRGLGLSFIRLSYIIIMT